VPVGELAGASPPAAVSGPRPTLQRVTDRRLPCGVIYPQGHVAGRALPVLLHLAGLAQGIRAVRDDWQPRQEWADAGYAVVVIGHRGTPGVAPSFEKVVHRRLADLVLTDLAEGLAALADKHPDLDLTRVALRGAGVGGWLAALAVLRRPDLFTAAVAESPLLEWERAEPALAERYRGRLDAGNEISRRHSLSGAAGASEAEVTRRVARGRGSERAVA